jgi:hypothetical protein
MDVAPSLKVTISPVKELALLITVAVNVTELPNVIGELLALSIVLVGALLTT